MYTEEEFYDLIDQAPSFNLINDINYILTTPERRHKTPLIDIKEHLNRKYYDFYKFIYELPLKNVPLFINNKLQIVRVIATWRLRIGK